MPNSLLLLNYLRFGTCFFARVKVNHKGFILTFWLRYVLLPWQQLVKKQGLNKIHGCMNSGFQYRTSEVIFRGLPYCDCHCCHAISLLLVMNNSTCVYFCLLSIMNVPVRNKQICSRSATDLFQGKQTNSRLIYRLQRLFSVCADVVH